MSVFYSVEWGQDLWFEGEWPQELQFQGAVRNPAAAPRPPTESRGFLQMPAMPKISELSRHLFLSNNMKTGFSINLRINGTAPVRKAHPKCGIPMIGPSCRPTAWCVRYCYAKCGRPALSFGQRRYLANMMRFYAYEQVDRRGRHMVSDEDVLEDATKVIGKCRRRGMDNCRLSGSGDLMPGYVRFLNLAATLDPDFIWWGMTKRADLMKHIARRSNIVFQVSLDYTTPGLDAPLRSRRRGMRRNPAVFSLTDFDPEVRARKWGYCWATEYKAVERTPQGITDPYLMPLRNAGMPIYTVFGDHNGQGHTDTYDFFQCPATHPMVIPFYQQIPYLEWPVRADRVKNIPPICQVCRWCMTPPAQRAALGMRTPLEVVYRFEALASKHKIQMPDLPQLRQNPIGDQSFWDEVQDDLARMPVGMGGGGLDEERGERQSQLGY